MAVKAEDVSERAALEVCVSAGVAPRPHALLEASEVDTAQDVVERAALDGPRERPGTKLLDNAGHTPAEPSTRIHWWLSGKRGIVSCSRGWPPCATPATTLPDERDQTATKATQHVCKHLRHTRDSLPRLLHKLRRPANRELAASRLADGKGLLGEVPLQPPFFSRRSACTVNNRTVAPHRSVNEDLGSAQS